MTASRRALVTGAAGGIGSAVVRELHVAGIDCFGERAEMTDRVAVAALVEGALAGGPIDILVCCAGFDRVEPFFESEPATWERMLDVNLRSVIQLSHALLPAMAGRGWGRLVCVASDAGRVGSAGEAVYSAAKAGVIALCKSLGQELARSGVTCNAVSPGPTNTRLLREFEDEFPEKAEKLRRRIPAGRFGEPEDVAALVGFLCSERAGYINGQVISVNGGLHSP